MTTPSANRPQTRADKIKAEHRRSIATEYIYNYDDIIDKLLKNRSNQESSLRSRAEPPKLVRQTNGTRTTRSASESSKREPRSSISSQSSRGSHSDEEVDYDEVDCCIVNPIDGKVLGNGKIRIKTPKPTPKKKR